MTPANPPANPPENSLLAADNQQDSAQEQMFEHSLRPARLDEFIGQTSIKEQLTIFIQAARQRDEALIPQNHRQALRQPQRPRLHD